MLIAKDLNSLEAWDKAYLWHPFTQMSSFLKESPLIIKEAKGVILKDVHGKEYLDGVSSLWCNVHGHRKKEIDRAINAQLKRVAHSTLLGASNVPSIMLAKRLVEIAPKWQGAPQHIPPSPGGRRKGEGDSPPPFPPPSRGREVESDSTTAQVAGLPRAKGLTKVFYSDDGSTAVEAALKMAFQYWQQSGHPEKRKFLALQYAYHGDTFGAVAVGGIPQFHDIYRPLTLSSTSIFTPSIPSPLKGEGEISRMSEPSEEGKGGGTPGRKSLQDTQPAPVESVPPSPGGRGKGEGDSPPPFPPPSRGREAGRGGTTAQTLFAPSPHCYRCPVGKSKETCRMACLGEMEKILAQHHQELAALIIEPLIQGAGGMIVHPTGYLKGVRELCSKYNVLLIADEILTGFGRTGKMFACEHEGVVPDIMAISKGLTGGYLPLAATLVTEDIYNAFLGDQGRTFFHGHTYTGNPLACSAALASLEVFEKEAVLKNLQPKMEFLRNRLQDFYGLESVGDVRHCGLIAGIELVKDRQTREPYPSAERIGHRVCLEARNQGALLRPLGDVIVVMPPLSITLRQLDKLVGIVWNSVKAVASS